MLGIIVFLLNCWLLLNVNLLLFTELFICEWHQCDFTKKTLFLIRLCCLTEWIRVKQFGVLAQLPAAHGFWAANWSWSFLFVCVSVCSSGCPSRLCLSLWICLFLHCCTTEHQTSRQINIEESSAGRRITVSRSSYVLCFLHFFFPVGFILTFIFCLFIHHIQHLKLTVFSLLPRLNKQNSLQ